MHTLLVFIHGLVVEFAMLPRLMQLHWDIKEQEHFQLPRCNKQHEHFVWDDLCFYSTEANASRGTR